MNLNISRQWSKNKPSLMLSKTLICTLSVPICYRSLEGPVSGLIFSLYQLVMILLLPLLLMSMSYYQVITVLWRSNRKMAKLTNNLTDKKEVSRL